jgi:metal-dependent amidase/aminoacylase/carboxypeptidase family protein
MQTAFGERAIVQSSSAQPSSASEDYAEFIAAGVPSVVFGIGATDAALLGSGKQPPSNHSPFFAPVPEPTIKTGAAVLALAVMTAASTGSDEPSSATE